MQTQLKMPPAGRAQISTGPPRRAGSWLELLHPVSRVGVKGTAPGQCPPSSRERLDRGGAPPSRINSTYTIEQLQNNHRLYFKHPQSQDSICTEAFTLI